MKTKDIIISREEYKINDNSKGAMALLHPWNYTVYHYGNKYPEVLFAEILLSLLQVNLIHTL